MFGDQILHFLEFFYYLFRFIENRCFHANLDHKKTAIFNKSKKISKNVKFGLQTHINMENKMNGSDQPLGF